MDIKKVDEKPMVIHTKEKSKLHAKGMSELKVKGRQKKEQEIRPSVRQESRMHDQYRKAKSGKRETVKKKAPVSHMVASVLTERALDELEGGSEVYGAYRTARILAKPASDAVEAGRSLYRFQAFQAKQQKIKKKQAGSQIKEKAGRKNTVRENAEKAEKTIKNGSQKAAGESVKATRKTAAKEASKATAKTMATTAGTGAGGVLSGIVVGQAMEISMDKRDIRNSTRNRMIKLFVANLQQKENQDSIGKALKDMVMMRFSILVKYMVRYVGLFLLSLFAIVALIALPVIAIVAVIYNSPFSVFFPSISSGETIQEVLSAYVSEFNGEVDEELRDCAGYDTSEKIYVNYEGAGEPDNFCDILMVYMIKHGDGDTATDMTDKAKQNLKAVFDDMCGYTITRRLDVDTDEEGNTTTTEIKEVNVELKSCYDMISVYGFEAEEQEVLAELMKPECLAMLGYTGGGGDPGEGLSPEQYQAIVDSVSSENGKKVVAFALSKTGYPYSQAYRDSGDYYDCSSLAYYA